MWLLDSSVHEKICGAYSKITPEALTEVAARVGDEPGPVVQTMGSTRIIPIEGVLTKFHDPWMSYFGERNTTYSDISKLIFEANGDPNIDKILLSIDSPGGTASGMYSLMDAIDGSVTPVHSVVTGICASAAYGIASRTQSITADSESCEVGSVGVVVSIRNFDGSRISSSKAPEKAPDHNTDEGVRIIRKDLDSHHDMFVSKISEGRGVSADVVNETYGRGGTVLSGEALKRGMIDAIGAPKEAQKTKQTAGRKTVDITQLRTEHSALYECVLNEGVSKERSRVKAHLIGGVESGDVDTAIKAIRSGDEMTEEIRITYQMAAAKRGNLNARQEDERGMYAANGVKAGSPEPKELETVAQKSAREEQEVLAEVIQRIKDNRE